MAWTRRVFCQRMHAHLGRRAREFSCAHAPRHKPCFAVSCPVYEKHTCTKLQKVSRHFAPFEKAKKCSNGKLWAARGLVRTAAGPRSSAKLAGAKRDACVCPGLLHISRDSDVHYD
jgi:hypothetical protein